jgi:hypothetical protein
LLIAQTKVINKAFLKLFAANAQPYFKKPWLYSLIMVSAALAALHVWESSYANA